MDKVEWAMSSGSIIQGMFPLQPTSKWVGRSDSWDETLDRTNPPWLYHPGFLQILHSPKGAQNIFLTWLIENEFSVTHLCSPKLSVQVKCEHRSLLLQHIPFMFYLNYWLELICLLFLFSGHLRPLLDINNGCFTIRCFFTHPSSSSSLVVSMVTICHIQRHVVIFFKFIF